MGKTTVQKIINDDSTLNKEAFNKVAKELRGCLKELIVPTGRSYINFYFPEDKAPDFEEHQKIIDLEEQLIPNLTLGMRANYHIESIPDLFTQWYEAHSVKLSRESQCLKDQPAATRFCTQVGKEVEKILSEKQIFKKNKWMPSASAEVEFENADTQYADEYTDKLTIRLAISILQG